MSEQVGSVGNRGGMMFKTLRGAKYNLVYGTLYLIVVGKQVMSFHVQDNACFYVLNMGNYRYTCSWCPRSSAGVALALLLPYLLDTTAGDRPSEVWQPQSVWERFGTPTSRLGTHTR